MQFPDFRTLQLNEGVVRETSCDAEQMVLWLPGKRNGRDQEWERISSVPRAQTQIEQGIGAVSATAIQARQSLRTFLGRMIRRVQKSGDRSWTLPSGQWADQIGERRRDLLLVWSQEDGRLDEAWIKSRWPECQRIQQLGKDLYLVAGVKTPETENETLAGSAPAPQESPVKLAEEILNTARRTGDPRRIASALTDLGIVLARQGNAPRAVALLEEALRLVRQSGDRSLESDVLDNLGLALLTAGQAPRALSIFQEGLEIARSAGNPFAEKMALMHLGMACLTGRDSARACTFFDQALAIARQLCDRQHEADLLWQLSIVHAEAGQHDRAVARAQEAVALFKQVGNPQAHWLESQLQKYQAGQNAAPIAVVRFSESSSASVFGGQIAASGWTDQAIWPGQPQASGSPGLLRMAFSAMKSMAHFAGSGFKPAPAGIYQKRLQTCGSCEHHTGLRCKVCGCFTSIKARMPHESCPIGKWAV
jgi:Tfp pilus assembly protein PilF